MTTLSQGRRTNITRTNNVNSPYFNQLQVNAYGYSGKNGKFLTKHNIVYRDAGDIVFFHIINGFSAARPPIKPQTKTQTKTQTKKPQPAHIHKKFLLITNNLVNKKAGAQKLLF